LLFSCPQNIIRKFRDLKGRALSPSKRRRDETTTGEGDGKIYDQGRYQTFASDGGVARDGVPRPLSGDFTMEAEEVRQKGNKPNLHDRT